MENNKKGLIICLVSVIVVLLVIIGVLAGIIIGGKKENNESKTSNSKIEQKQEEKKDKVDDKLLYNLHIIEDGVESSITIDKEGNVVCKEVKEGKEQGGFKTTLNEKAIKLLDTYFEDFVSDDSVALFKKENGKFLLDINLDESKEYQSIKKQSGYSSDDVGYDYMITNEMFRDLYNGLEKISKGEKNQEMAIGLALQQY